MAVDAPTLQIGGIQAWMTVDGAPTDSYGIEGDGLNRTCWIASQSGKTFAVHWRDVTQGYRNATGGFVKLDGKSAGIGQLLPGSDSGSTVTTAKLDGFVRGNISQEFCFSNVELTDDDAYYGKTDVSNLGQVELSIRPIAAMGVPRKEAFRGNANASNSALKLHEKSKKGLAHCITGGKERVMPHSDIIIPAYIPGGDMTFTFKYRSLSILQANGIVPYDGKRAAEEMDDEDEQDEESAQPKASGSGAREPKPTKAELNRIATLEAELKSLQNKHKKVKHEAGGDGEFIDLTEGTDVKKERTTNKVLPGGIIDLT